MNGRPPLACAIDFNLRIYFQVPESWSGRKKHQALTGMLRPTITPDADNLCKAAADALTGIAIRDDKFIVHAVIEKWYSDRPRVEMVVRECDVWPDQIVKQMTLEDRHKAD